MWIFCLANNSHEILSLMFPEKMTKSTIECRLLQFSQRFKRYGSLRTTNTVLTFTVLWINTADDKLMIILLFFPKQTGFDFSCKLFQMETICMKSQILFPGKTKKNISICRLLKFLSRMVSVKATSKLGFSRSLSLCK